MNDNGLLCCISLFHTQLFAGALLVELFTNGWFGWICFRLSRRALSSCFKLSNSLNKIWRIRRRSASSRSREQKYEEGDEEIVEGVGNEGAEEGREEEGWELIDKGGK